MGLFGNLNGVKPGVKTTELLVAAVFGISNLLVSFGVVHTGIPATKRPLVEAAAAIGVALISVGYALSRAIAKHNAAGPLDYLHALLSAASTGDPRITDQVHAALPGILERLGASNTKQLEAENELAKFKSYLAPSMNTAGSNLSYSTGSTAGTETESGPAGSWPTVPVAQSQDA